MGITLQKNIYIDRIPKNPGVLLVGGKWFHGSCTTLDKKRKVNILPLTLSLYSPLRNILALGKYSYCPQILTIWINNNSSSLLHLSKIHPSFQK